VKRKAAAASLNDVTMLLVENINGGVANVFSNQRKLEAESRTLQAQVVKFNKQTTQWLQLLDNFNNALKVAVIPLDSSSLLLAMLTDSQELGDVENWSRSIEKDMVVIAASLEYAAKTGDRAALGKSPAAASPTPAAPASSAPVTLNPADAPPSAASPAVTQPGASL
jgi:hypothetical protein